MILLKEMTKIITKNKPFSRTNIFIEKKSISFKPCEINVTLI